MGAQERFRHSNVRLQADRTVVPCARGAETVPVTLAVYPDHGRPAFVGSTIGSREVLVAAADDLDPAESQRLNNALGRTMEQLLDDGIIKSNAVFSSDQDGKPDIHLIVIGDPYKDSSLRLYCHAGVHDGKPVLYQDGRTRKRGADRIERAFRSEGGYFPPRSWDNRSSSARVR